MAIEPTGTVPTTTDDMQFATGSAAVMTQPDSDHRTGSGFTSVEKPKYVNFNWIFNKIGLWITYIYNNIVSAFSYLDGHETRIATIEAKTPVTGNFTVTYTGFSSDVTKTAYYNITYDAQGNKLVMLALPKVREISADYIITLSGIPEGVHPVVEYDLPFVVENYDSDHDYQFQTGMIKLNTDGTAYLYAVNYADGFIYNNRLGFVSSTYYKGHPTQTLWYTV